MWSPVLRTLRLVEMIHLTPTGDQSNCDDRMGGADTTVRGFLVGGGTPPT